MSPEEEEEFVTISPEAELKSLEEDQLTIIRTMLENGMSIEMIAANPTNFVSVECLEMI